MKFASLAMRLSPQATLPMTVHQHTLLKDLALHTPASGYILATDDAGHLVGLVPVGEIHKRLAVSNPSERTRWAEMPLACLIGVLFPTDSATSVPSVAGALDYTAIMENDRLIGIATRHDVFLSWRHVGEVLCGVVCDPLTGLMNRLTYERRLQEEWSRAQRTGCSVGLIMVDLDHFKAINDRYGHSLGDEVLGHVASKLESSLRSYDVLARYGGDEFIALCVGCRRGEIEIPIQRIFQSLRTSPLTLEGKLVPLSASVGAAVRHDGFVNSEPADLFALADRCLYDAKRARGKAIWKELGAKWTSESTCSFAAEGPVSFPENLVLETGAHQS
jgi:diguanylate cyclase (GGDEF)-like protein